MDMIPVHNRREIGADIGRGARYGHGFEKGGLGSGVARTAFKHKMCEARNSC
jgi:hypothetical protein